MLEIWFRRKQKRIYSAIDFSTNNVRLRSSAFTKFWRYLVFWFVACSFKQTKFSGTKIPLVFKMVYQEKIAGIWLLWIWCYFKTTIVKFIFVMRVGILSMSRKFYSTMFGAGRVTIIIKYYHKNEIRKIWILR